MATLWACLLARLCAVCRKQLVRVCLFAHVYGDLLALLEWVGVFAWVLVMTDIKAEYFPSICHGDRNGSIGLRDTSSLELGLARTHGNFVGLLASTTLRRVSWAAGADVFLCACVRRLTCFAWMSWRVCMGPGDDRHKSWIFSEHLPWRSNWIDRPEGHIITWVRLGENAWQLCGLAC